MRILARAARRVFAWSLLIGTVATAAASLQCGLLGTTCTLIDCISGAEIEIRVQRTIAELAEGSIRICRAGTCIEKPSSLQAERMSKEGWGLSIERPIRTVIVAKPEGRGWSTVRVSLTIEEGDFLPDGERYTGEIRDRDGVLVFAFDEAIDYRDSTPNGPSCGPECSQGTIVLRQEPGPPVPCTNHACTSGVRFEAELAIRTSLLKSSVLEVCRRRVCARSVPNDDEAATTIPFEGDLEGVTLEVDRLSDTSTRAVLTIVEAPSLLLDGDDYSLAVIDDDGPYPQRTELFRRTVEAYDERWPNGEACDLQPCRTAGSIPDGGL